MDFDYIIVGSGFGGSVSGLRLVEKGYRVLMLEKGRRLQAPDFPKTNWNLRRWMWLPALGFRGLFKMTFLRHVTALTGVGVGGGSLVYANTLPTPKDEFFSADSWKDLADWKSELGPHYETALKMLGAAESPLVTQSDRVFRDVAKELGREEHYHQARVGVYFGTPGETVADPYFGGRGPDRTGCNSCGGCMLGCRFNAKNTLDKNYLYLAEKQGLEIKAEREVTHVAPMEGGYKVTARAGFGWRRRKETFTARKVIFSGGVLGTVGLLLRMKNAKDGLPKLSDRLGHYVRTNSEVLMGIVSRRRDVDYSKGIAITSIVHTDDHSHMEPVRYSSGSGFFRLLMAPHAPGSNAATRLAKTVATMVRHPIKTLRTYTVPNMAKHSLILLYMRTLEGHLTLKLGRRLHNGFTRGLTTELADGPAPTASIPEASKIGELIAKQVEGQTTSMLTETVFGTPTTAHILGGATMGDDASQGVINARHEVFGYDGLYVIDGAAMSANPGVNPSLTITALAERAMSFIPRKE